MDEFDDKTAKIIKNYGFLYKEIKYNKEKGEMLLKSLADKGNNHAQLFYGLTLLQNEDLNTDESKASFYCKESINNGNKYANFFYIFSQLCYKKEINYDFKYNSLILLLSFISVQSNKNLSKKGVECIKYFVNKEEINSMFFYGKMLFNNKYEIIKTDEKKALYYLKKSADKGHNGSIAYYGDLLYRGYGSKHDKKEAAKYLRIAANAGDLQSMCTYSKMLLFGDKIRKNVKEGQKYLKRSADLGNVDSMFYYAKSQLKSNKEEAFKYFQIAAEKEDPRSNYECGKILCLEKEDWSKKFKAIYYFNHSLYWYYMESKSLFRLGEIYFDEDDDDIKKTGLRFLKMAAEEGNRKAKLKYGILLLKGNETSQNIKQGLYYIISWFFDYIDDEKNYKKILKVLFSILILDLLLLTILLQYY